MRTRTLLAITGVVGILCMISSANAKIIHTTIMAYQDTSSALHDTLGATDTLVVQGVITADDRNPTGFGFYLEDPSGTLYRGCLVFTGSSNVFADSGYARGDRIEVMARQGLFQGGEELISLSGNAFGPPPPTTKLGSEAVPGPTIVTTADLAFNSSATEQYEGMHVQLDKPQKVIADPITLPALGAGQVLVNNADGTGSGNQVIINVINLPFPCPAPRPSTGDVITFANGVIDERNDYLFQVRDQNDIVSPAPPSLCQGYAISNNEVRVVFNTDMDQTSVEDPSKYSLDTFTAINTATQDTDPQAVILGTDPQTPAVLERVNVQSVMSSGGGTLVGTQSQDFRAGITPIKMVQEPPAGTKYMGPAGSDTTQYNNEVVTVRGIVTARFGGQVYIQDDTALRSGILFFAPQEPIQQGDDVTVAGIALEFFDNTEFSGALYEKIHSSGNSEPAAINPEGGVIQTLNDPMPAGGRSSAAEDYEHMKVEVNDVAVAVSFIQGAAGEYTVREGADFLDPNDPDTVRVDNRGFQNGNLNYNASRGDQITSLTGVFEWFQGRWRMEPRDDNDIVFGPVVSVADQGASFALRTPVPNPVSFSKGAANISFTLPQRGEASLKLYDLRGRLIQSLTNGQVMEAGNHVLTWDGTNTAGSRVGAGIYFVQLRLGNQLATDKVVVAE